MHSTTYQSAYQARQKPPRRKRKLWSLLLLLVIIYGIWALLRPLPQLQPLSSVTQLEIQAAASNLAWPAKGESAEGIVGTTVLHAHGPQQPVPTASTAKLITALVVLQKKPLATNQQGPELTLTAQDVALFNSYYQQGGSVVQVADGEQISEYQVLQALMLPSANNLADSLVIWAYGSLPNYAAAAQLFLKAHGLDSTHIGSDASGFSPSTTSTATDLVKLGELAMQNPALAEIVDQSTASLPVAGQVKNVNPLLGNYHIIGVKTGNTDEAGGVFVSASQVRVNGKIQTIVTAVANAPSLQAALSSSVPLVLSAQNDFTDVNIVQAGSVIGRYKLPWGGTVPAIAASDLTVAAPKGSGVPATISLQPITTKTTADQQVGLVKVVDSQLYAARSVSINLQSAPSKPTLWWRLVHP